MAFVIAINIPNSFDEVGAPDLTGLDATSDVLRSSGAAGAQLVQLVIEGADAVLGPAGTIAAAWIAVRWRQDPKAERSGGEEVTVTVLRPDGTRMEVAGTAEEVGSVLGSLDSEHKQ